MAITAPGAGLNLLSHENVPVLRMKMSDEEVDEELLQCFGGEGLRKQCMCAWAPAMYNTQSQEPLEVQVVLREAWAFLLMLSDANDLPAVRHAR